jgi:mersacidin/lichenicidin family type 2 lantibiotic
MSKINVIKAWKDPRYRSSLSAGEQALVPEHPAGAVELSDEDLGVVAGGMPPRNETWVTVTNGHMCCCTGCFSCD